MENIKITDAGLAELLRVDTDIIDSFQKKSYSHTTEYTDLDVTTYFNEYGFFTGAGPRGFICKTEDETMRPDKYSYYSIYGDDGKGICSVRLKERKVWGRDLVMTEYELDVPDDIPEVLKELDKKGQLIYFGMHIDGKRHGRGVEFSYEKKKLPGLFSGKVPVIRPVMGLWQAGTMTHKVEDDKLVPVSG